MGSRRLGLAAASLLGAATLLTAAPVNADELVCRYECVPDKPGAEPFLKIENAFGKVETVLGKWQPESAPFIKIDNALGKIEDVMHKYGD